MPLQAGHISSTMTDFIGFIMRAARATTRAINYTSLKLRNQTSSRFMNLLARRATHRVSGLFLLSFIACSCFIICRVVVRHHQHGLDARSSCSLLVQHCLVETVVGDLFQEIADQPCRAVLAHRPRGLTQRLQHAVAEWQRFVWQR